MKKLASLFSFLCLFALSSQAEDKQIKYWDLLTSGNIDAVLADMDECLSNPRTRDDVFLGAHYVFYFMADEGRFARFFDPIYDMLKKHGIDYSTTLPRASYICCGGQEYAILYIVYTRMNSEKYSGLAFVERFLEEGLDINTMFFWDLNTTLLNTAISWENVEMIKWAFSKGAKVTKDHPEGGNTLEFAQFTGNSEIIGLIMDHSQDDLDQPMINALEQQTDWRALEEFQWVLESPQARVYDANGDFQNDHVSITKHTRRYYEIRPRSSLPENREISLRPGFRRYRNTRAHHSLPPSELDVQYTSFAMEHPSMARQRLTYLYLLEPQGVDEPMLRAGIRIGAENNPHLSFHAPVRMDRKNRKFFKVFVPLSEDFIVELKFVSKKWRVRPDKRESKYLRLDREWLDWGDHLVILPAPETF